MASVGFCPTGWKGAMKFPKRMVPIFTLVPRGEPGTRRSRRRRGRCGRRQPCVRHRRRRRTDLGKPGEESSARSLVTRSLICPRTRSIGTPSRGCSTAVACGRPRSPRSGATPTCRRGTSGSQCQYQRPSRCRRFVRRPSRSDGLGGAGCRRRWRRRPRRATSKPDVMRSFMNACMRSTPDGLHVGHDVDEHDRRGRSPARVSPARSIDVNPPNDAPTNTARRRPVSSPQHLHHVGGEGLTR